MTPALAAQYGPRKGKPRLPAWLDTLQIRPPTPSATMRVAQALETSQVPTTLTSSTRRNSVTPTLSSGPRPNPGPLPPATLATRVTVPSSSLTRATAASTASSSDTSACTVSARTPRAVISAARESRSSWLAVPCNGASW